MESSNEFLRRVNKLESFKHIDVFYFDLEFESTEDLYNISSSFVQLDPDISRISYGPINGRYFNQLEAEQINMCFAIKSGDIKWIKENCFDTDMLSSQISYNYGLFKHIFVWMMPYFPTRCKTFNKQLCMLLGQGFDFEEMFSNFW